ncbi:homoserine dehydrogenase [bacterium BMS3Abin10]|nr:homoserine dehydrogenase [bacterium BMS3Abin10]GBE38817.1 homoserine dehydrogenase [bacterium BMS3Bbin08]HDK41456.1 homoserine dehydrogenase [Nitrospirota bacterium]
MKKQGVSIGIIGLGTIGTGVARILLKKRGELEARLGFPIVIKRVADRDIRRKRAVRLPLNVFTTSADKVLDDPDIDIVVELAGGIHPAKEIVLRAIKNRKHVVTANKLLLATAGTEIFRAALKNRVEVWFEAAVAGGIPIIKIIREALAGNTVQAIYGIINGTSNYILTKMTDEGVDFAEALKQAQALGYAEADPALDVQGGDSAHKLAILASLAFGVPFSLKKIYTEGITRITPMDIAFASEFGYRIKLLAIAKRTNREIELRVHPTMLPGEYLISGVNGVFNAVYVEGDAVGPTLYYGKGAGDMPTGSAVVSDIVDIARNIRAGAVNRIQGLGAPQGSGLKIKKMDNVRSCYYLRFSVMDKPGVLSRISGILGSHDISIKSVIQKTRKKEKAVPLVMMTHEAREKDMVDALKEINRLSVVSGRAMYIRVESAQT